MKATEMAEQVKKQFPGLVIDFVADTEDRQEVEVYGFGKTADWKATKAGLEALGFICYPNGGIWRGKVERPVQERGTWVKPPTDW